MDLRDKLSGLVTQTHQATQVHEGPKVQRRVASVVFNSSNVTQAVASTTVPNPVSAKPTATVKKSSNVMVLYAFPSLCFNVADAIFFTLRALDFKSLENAESFLKQFF